MLTQLDLKMSATVKQVFKKHFLPEKVSYYLTNKNTERQGKKAISI
jgi:hypothetical protein